MKLGNYYVDEVVRFVCLFVCFRVIGIDSKHDVFINQDIFPMQEGLGN